MKSIYTWPHFVTTDPLAPSPGGSKQIGHSSSSRTASGFCSKRQLAQDWRIEQTHSSFSLDSSDDFVQQISPRLLDKRGTDQLGRSFDLRSVVRFVSTGRERIVSSADQSCKNRSAQVGTGGVASTYQGDSKLVEVEATSRERERSS